MMFGVSYVWGGTCWPCRACGARARQLHRTRAHLTVCFCLKCARCAVCTARIGQLHTTGTYMAVFASTGSALLHSGAVLALGPPWCPC